MAREHPIETDPASSVHFVLYADQLFVSQKCSDRLRTVLGPHGRYFYCELVIQQLRNRFRILVHRRQSEVPPFLGLTRTRSLPPLHPLFRIYAEDQSNRYLIAVRKLQYHFGDLARVALLPSLDTLQQFQDRAD